MRARAHKLQIHATARDGLAGLAACTRGRRAETQDEVERLWTHGECREVTEGEIKTGSEDDAPQKKPETKKIEPPEVSGKKASGALVRSGDGGDGVAGGGGCMAVLCVRSGLHLVCR